MTVYIPKPQIEEEGTNSKDNRIRVPTTKESNVELEKTVVLEKQALIGSSSQEIS